MGGGPSICAMTTGPAYIILAAVVGGAALLVAIATVLIKCRRRTEETEGQFKKTNKKKLYKFSRTSF